MSRFAKRVVSYRQIGAWFNRALDRSEPRPSEAVLDRLARRLQILLNQANNSELERAGPVPLNKLKDVSEKEWKKRKVQKVGTAAKKLMDATVELENYAGPNLPCPGGDVSLPELQETLLKITFFAPAPGPTTPARGRPPAPWRDPGLKFVTLVRAAILPRSSGSKCSSM